MISHAIYVMLYKKSTASCFWFITILFLVFFLNIHTAHKIKSIHKSKWCGGFSFLSQFLLIPFHWWVMRDWRWCILFIMICQWSVIFLMIKGFFTISDLLLPFKYWDSVLSFLSTRTCSDYDVQTNPFTHQKNAMPSLSLFYFPLPFSPFIIISLLKLLLLRKHYLSFFLSSDLDTAQGAVNLICFMMVVITFL